MKPIQELISQAGQKNFTTGSSQDTQENKRRRDAVINIFARLQAIYPHKWASAYASDDLLDLAIAEWCDAIKGLTGEQIKMGFSKLDPDWPPTPVGFREMCKSREHNTAAYRIYDKNKLIENKPLTSSDEASRVISGLKEMLK